MKHQKILDAMFERMEVDANNNNSRRTYLGMSGFDTHCKRKQWLEFRHAFTPFINYQSHSHFSDGHKCEDILVERLVASGLPLEPVDKDGSQFTFIDGFLKGHSDGRILGWEGQDYVFEAKATNDDKKEKLRKLALKDESIALQKWDKNYYAQSQLYMHYSGIHKHLLFATSHGAREKKNSKGDFRTVVVETEYNQLEALRLVNEAKDIIATDKMPEAPWSLEAKKPLCWWGEETYQRCESYDFCTGKDLADPDCFNCAHITFIESGVGRCNLTQHEMLPDDMQGWKECHKYHPSLIHKFEPIALEEDGSVIYRNVQGREIINDDSRLFKKEINGEV